jgi:hypothetical protein
VFVLNHAAAYAGGAHLSQVLFTHLGTVAYSFLAPVASQPSVAFSISEYQS